MKKIWRFEIEIVKETKNQEIAPDVNERTEWKENKKIVKKFGEDI